MAGAVKSAGLRSTSGGNGAQDAAAPASRATLSAPSSHLVRAEDEAAGADSHRPNPPPGQEEGRHSHAQLSAGEAQAKAQDQAQAQAEAEAAAEAEAEAAAEAEAEARAKAEAKADAEAEAEDETAAAVKVQSAYRGHRVRALEPLRQLQVVRKVSGSLQELERQLAAAEVREGLRESARERLRMSESVMSLLLQLDSIQRCDPAVREARKSVARAATRLQDAIDALAAPEPSEALPPSPSSSASPAVLSGGSGADIIAPVSTAVPEAGGQTPEAGAAEVAAAGELQLPAQQQLAGEEAAGGGSAEESVPVPGLEGLSASLQSAEGQAKDLADEEGKGGKMMEGEEEEEEEGEGEVKGKGEVRKNRSADFHDEKGEGFASTEVAAAEPEEVVPCDRHMAGPPELTVEGNVHEGANAGDKTFCPSREEELMDGAPVGTGGDASGAAMGAREEDVIIGARSCFDSGAAEEGEVGAPAHEGVGGDGSALGSSGYASAADAAAKQQQQEESAGAGVLERSEGVEQQQWQPQVQQQQCQLAEENERLRRELASEVRRVAHLEAAVSSLAARLGQLEDMYRRHVAGGEKPATRREDDVRPSPQPASRPHDARMDAAADGEERRKGEQPQQQEAGERGSTSEEGSMSEVEQHIMRLLAQHLGLPVKPAGRQREPANCTEEGGKVGVAAGPHKKATKAGVAATAGEGRQGAAAAPATAAAAAAAAGRAKRGSPGGGAVKKGLREGRAPVSSSAMCSPLMYHTPARQVAPAGDAPPCKKLPTPSAALPQISRRLRPRQGVRACSSPFARYGAGSLNAQQQAPYPWYMFAPAAVDGDYCMYGPGSEMHPLWLQQEEDMGHDEDEVEEDGDEEVPSFFMY
eukprot:jgi/Mesen1/495/ME000104S10590